MLCFSINIQEIQRSCRELVGAFVGKSKQRFADLPCSTNAIRFTCQKAPSWQLVTGSVLREVFLFVLTTWQNPCRSSCQDSSFGQMSSDVEPMFGSWGVGIAIRSFGVLILSTSTLGGTFRNRRLQSFSFAQWHSILTLQFVEHLSFMIKRYRKYRRSLHASAAQWLQRHPKASASRPLLTTPVAASERILHRWWRGSKMDGKIGGRDLFVQQKLRAKVQRDPSCQ